MELKVIELIEHEDGSATMVVDISHEAAKVVMQVGLHKLIMDYAIGCVETTEPDSKEEEQSE